MPRKNPVSEKQLAANRANAKKSTGPRGKEGRNAVRYNALRHGLTSQVAVLPDEDLVAHEEFCHPLIAEFAPANAMERNVAQSIANDMWRLNRARSLEDNMFAVGQVEADPDPDPDYDPTMQAALTNARTFRDHADKFGLLSLYEQRINRTVHKNLALLRQLQAERKVNERPVRPFAAPRPFVVNNLPARAAGNGFAYANSVSAPETAFRTPCRVFPMAAAA